MGVCHAASTDPDIADTLSCGTDNLTNFAAYYTK